MIYFNKQRKKERIKINKKNHYFIASKKINDTNNNTHTYIIIVIMSTTLPKWIHAKKYATKTKATAAATDNKNDSKPVYQPRSTPTPDHISDPLDVYGVAILPAGCSEVFISVDNQSSRVSNLKEYCKRIAEVELPITEFLRRRAQSYGGTPVAEKATCASSIFKISFLCPFDEKGKQVNFEIRNDDLDIHLLFPMIPIVTSHSNIQGQNMINVNVLSTKNPPLSSASSSSFMKKHHSVAQKEKMRDKLSFFSRCTPDTMRFMHGVYWNAFDVFTTEDYTLEKYKDLVNSPQVDYSDYPADLVQELKKIGYGGTNTKTDPRKKLILNRTLIMRTEASKLAEQYCHVERLWIDTLLTHYPELKKKLNQVCKSIRNDNDNSSASADGDDNDDNDDMIYTLLNNLFFEQIIKPYKKTSMVMNLNYVMLPVPTFAFAWNAKLKIDQFHSAPANCNPYLNKIQFYVSPDLSRSTLAHCGFWNLEDIDEDDDNDFIIDDNHHNNKTKIPKALMKTGDTWIGSLNPANQANFKCKTGMVVVDGDDKEGNQLSLTAVDLNINEKFQLRSEFQEHAVGKLCNFYGKMHLKSPFDAATTTTQKGPKNHGLITPRTSPDLSWLIRSGFLILPTGEGKTIVSFYLLKWMYDNNLIHNAIFVCNFSDAIDQIIERASEVFENQQQSVSITNFENTMSYLTKRLSAIEQWHEENKTKRRMHIAVSTIQTLTNGISTIDIEKAKKVNATAKSGVQKKFDKLSLCLCRCGNPDKCKTILIVDESHTIAADTYRNIVSKVCSMQNVPYRLGMTACIERKDGKTPISMLFLGKPIVTVTILDLKRKLFRYVQVKIKYHDVGSIFVVGGKRNLEDGTCGNTDSTFVQFRDLLEQQKKKQKLLDENARMPCLMDILEPITTQEIIQPLTMLKENQKTKKPTTTKTATTNYDISEEELLALEEKKELEAQSRIFEDEISNSSNATPKINSNNILHYRRMIIASSHARCQYMWFTLIFELMYQKYNHKCCLVQVSSVQHLTMIVQTYNNIKKVIENRSLMDIIKKENKKLHKSLETFGSKVMLQKFLVGDSNISKIPAIKDTQYQDENFWKRFDDGMKVIAVTMQKAGTFYDNREVDCVILADRPINDIQNPGRLRAHDTGTLMYMVDCIDNATMYNALTFKPRSLFVEIEKFEKIEDYDVQPIHRFIADPDQSKQKYLEIIAATSNNNK